MVGRRESGALRNEGLGTVGVLGARGGAGASVTAALLARAAARRGPTALVDLGPPPALAVLLGTERSPGLRWPDLAGARGHVDPDHLARSLPRWARCTVLSADPERSATPPPGVEGDVLTALGAAHPTVVIDLGRLVPRGAGQGTGTVPGGCDVLLLVVPRDVPAVAAARVVRSDLLALGPPVGIVVRGPAPGGLGTAEVAQAVGLPLLGALPASRSLASALDRGLGPQPGRRGSRAVDRLVASLDRWTP